MSTILRLLVISSSVCVWIDAVAVPSGSLLVKELQRGRGKRGGDDEHLSQSTDGETLLLLLLLLAHRRP